MKIEKNEGKESDYMEKIEKKSNLKVMNFLRRTSIIVLSTLVSPS